MMESISKGTMKQYDKPLRLWWDHCKRHNISPFEASASEVLAFLINLYYQVGTYGTLNSYRSAVSLVLTVDIVSDPLLKRFFKGVSVLKPQKPRYESTWDPHTVLEYLKTLYPNDKISIRLLTQKLLMLLALVTSQRVQTLSKILISNMICSKELIQIKIPQRLKTSKINKAQPCLIIPYFQDQPQLCVASTLQDYIKRTAPLRNLVDELFITCNKPYRAATTQSLARWLKITLDKSGIDIPPFLRPSAQDTRLRQLLIGKGLI